MAIVRGVSCKENAFFRARDITILHLSGITPLKVKNVILEVSPLLSQILGDIELFVDLAGFIFEFSTFGPA